MLTKASPESLRTRNRALTLTALRRTGPMSHTDLAQSTGLSSATISAITGELAILEPSGAPEDSTVDVTDAAVNVA